MAQKEEKVAYVTMLLNDGYLPGAMVLAKSLRNSGSRVPLIVLYLKSPLSNEVYRELHECELFDRKIAVDNEVLFSRNLFELNILLRRNELSNALTKLNIWKLTDYNTVVYLDCDMLILKNIDNLFYDQKLQKNEVSASSDSGWPDIFNSGLIVAKPDLDTFNDLRKFYETNDSFDGADQGILNEFFNLKSEVLGTKWNRLPFTYNCTLNSNYEYLPAMIRFKEDIKVIHFIGKTKPWTNRSLCYGSQYAKVFDNNKNLFELWWDVYDQLFSDSTEVLEIAGHLQPYVEFSSSDDRQPQPKYKQPAAKAKTPSQFVDNNEIGNHNVEDVSVVNFPTYYYKPSTSGPIVDETSKGEAWKLKETKIEWAVEAPQKYEQKESNIPEHLKPEEVENEASEEGVVESCEQDQEKTSLGDKQDFNIDDIYDVQRKAVDEYVEKNPIFPWEMRKDVHATRTFENLNKFEPPIYSIEIMDSSESTSSMLDEDESEDNRLKGFSDGSKFQRYLEKVEQFKKLSDNESLDEIPIDTLSDEVIENLVVNVSLDNVLDTQLETELQVESEEEINSGEDRIQKSLDSLQLDDSITN